MRFVLCCDFEKSYFHRLLVDAIEALIASHVWPAGLLFERGKSRHYLESISLPPEIIQTPLNLYYSNSNDQSGQTYSPLFLRACGGRLLNYCGLDGA